MMESPSQETVSALLQAVRAGDRGAFDTLFSVVYDELRTMAHRQRHTWHGDISLNTTGLVHEAYLKLADQKQLPAESRVHFFAVAAKAMRHILCDHARDRTRQKRGGSYRQLSLSDSDADAVRIDLSDEQIETLSALDDSLEQLAKLDSRQSEIVECRFFGGLSIEDTAVALDISPATVKRDWMLARAWIYREMQRQLGD